ncbi:hypothetical protein LOZ39_004966 [Ophidiomyces ophidiicola]|nr:hypothetical protein LOZ64_005160 [Ophidiomyces ophidiicola]KAI1999850.1 hypothetical protein LOZ50_006431 [Ophidiomyces ophidiicola]KAI2013630.1 hypothetical protein LOZ46_005724 [Ophidiomyces ophidiicola]KAI2065681.1 hypothetical protein LOZ40_003923 [Ophidiomyces ophidiicola]KAI2070425.1 hypothetical protein LOZ39_004966 [Ophidiomyces ophidiicola]
MAAKSRMPIWIGVGVVGAGAYYLYNAGGDYKKATRNFEDANFLCSLDDASRAKHKIRGDVGRDAEGVGARAGAKIDEGADKVRDAAKRLDQRATDFAKERANELEKARQDTSKEFHQKLDSLERDAEKKAEEAKSGISSWFGGGKKDEKGLAMPATTLRNRAPKRAQTLLPPARTKQAGIQGFARTGKANAGAKALAVKDADSSLKRKLQPTDIGEPAVDPRPVKERKTLNPRATRSNNTSADDGSSSELEQKKSLALSPSNKADHTLNKYPVEPTTSTSTPNKYPEKENRPSSYYELIALYSSFLQALSLHFAHNGFTSPADLQSFLPSVERVWKKRKVLTTDIQRLLYIKNNGMKGESPLGSHLRLIDYGARILLEKVAVNSHKNGSQGPLNEDELKERFEENLEHIYLESHTKTPKFDCMQNIPLAPIYSVPKAFLSIGQKKASGIKLGIVKPKATEIISVSQEKTSRVKSCAAERQSGLLERIKSKALRQATLTPLLSKEKMLQRAAASRVPDIINVLLLLAPAASTGLDMSPSHAKKAFKLDTVIQNIRDSMRNPVSKEEISASLEILARPEISGNWVTIVIVNSIKSVVLRSSRDISPQIIKDKVSKLNF